jgi:catechol 2,3-dioxygenase-like lactoylglutathione lyase family enzyme
MRITTRLDHIAVAAHDTTAMVRWYEKVLGLVVHVESGPNPPQKQKVYLIGPPAEAVEGSPARVRQGMMIEVMPRNDNPRHERICHDPGLSHAAWYVDDFDAAVRHLKECKVQFLGEVGTAIGGGRILSFLDCEGNMMQIVERA